MLPLYYTCRTCPHLRHKKLWAIEERISRNPEKASEYSTEIQRLATAGYAKKFEPGEKYAPITWYISYHMREGADGFQPLI